METKKYELGIIEDTKPVKCRGYFCAVYQGTKKIDGAGGRFTTISQIVDSLIDKGHAYEYTEGFFPDETKNDSIVPAELRISGVMIQKPASLEELLKFHSLFLEKTLIEFRNKNKKEVKGGNK